MTSKPPIKSAKTPCCAYVRVSSKKQDDKDGPERQRDAITRFARANGYTIVEWFQDAITGTTEHREDFARMLNALKDGTAKIVIVERFDRLARRMITGEMCCDDIRREGGTLYDCAGNDLTEPENGDPDKVLIRQLMGAIAQHQKSITVLRMRAARERIRQRTGKCEGPKHFGDKPTERATMRRISDLWCEGHTLTKIVKILNRELHTTRTGQPWELTGLSRLVTRAIKPDAALRSLRAQNRPAARAQAHGAT